jgi:hypothetical protein
MEAVISSKRYLPASLNLYVDDASLSKSNLRNERLLDRSKTFRRQR